MNPLLILIAVLLVLPAVYLLLTRKPRRRGEGPPEGTLREDRTERPELTGTEQYKRRKPK